MTAGTVANVHPAAEVPDVDVALVWAATTDVDLPPLTDGFPSLPATFLDVGFASAPALHTGFVGGEFELRCLESNQATVRMTQHPGRRHLVADVVVRGAHRLRYRLAHAEVRAAPQRPRTADDPVEWRLLVTVHELHVATVSCALAEPTLLAGCPYEVWDGPYQYRCGQGKSPRDECARHGRYVRAYLCTREPGCRRPEQHGGRCC